MAEVVVGDQARKLRGETDRTISAESRDKYEPAAKRALRAGIPLFFLRIESLRRNLVTEPRTTTLMSCFVMLE